LGIRQSFSLISPSNSLEDFLLLRNPLFSTENTNLARFFHSNSEENGDTKMERKIRRFMSSHRAFSQFENKIDQNKNGDIFVDHSFGFENQNWIFNLPSSLSKFFVVWGIQKIASIRPQRRITEKAEQSQQTRVLFPHEISVKFENLQGLTAVLPLLHLFIESLQTKWFLQELMSGFQKKKVLKDQESKYPKGYLFVGPPGTGKTQLAQALAKEANLPLLCVSASEIQKQIEIGTRIGGLRLRKVFEKAREYAPCILFFDEIDAIGKTRGQQNSGDSQLLTEFLIQMDSFSVRDGFVVIGTTNFLSNLDSAFIRSGRFDRIFNLHSPSKKIRLDILQSAVYKKNGTEKSERKTESPKIPWKYFAHYTEDFSPAHLARLVNESFLYSCKKSISSSVLSQSVFVKKIHHSFESLQHGFHRIQNHRKNFLE
jgi:ATP-dependent Zn protease